MGKKRRALTRREIVGGVVGGAIGLGIAITQDSGVFAFSDSNLPPRSLDFIVVVLLVSASFGYTGWVRWKARHSQAALGSNGRPTLRRSPQPRFGRSILIWQLTMVGLLLYSFFHGGWNASSVGINARHPVEAFGIGFLVYCMFALALQLIVTRMGKLPMIRARNLATLAYIWPRSRRQKQFAFLAVCFLNPFTEELLFRGVLVHQFHQVLGSPYVPLAVGLLVTLGNHLYQGPQAMLTHIPFYFLAVALLYSPAGLVGCFGFHFAGDWFPIVGMKKALELYKVDFRETSSGESGTTERQREPGL